MYGAGGSSRAYLHVRLTSQSWEQHSPAAPMASWGEGAPHCCLARDWVDLATVERASVS